MLKGRMANSLHMVFIVAATICTSSVCNYASAKGDTELAQFAVEGLRAALGSLESAEIDFVKVKSGSGLNLATFDLAYLRNVDYAQVLSYVGLRGEENPFGDRTMGRYHLIQEGERKHLELFKVVPTLRENPEVAVMVTDGTTGQRLDQDLLLIMDKADFDSDMMVYSDPFKLFLHYYVRLDTDTGSRGHRWYYADFIDQPNAIATQKDGIITVEADYGKDENWEIIDGNTHHCTMEIDESTFLPLRTRYYKRSARSEFVLEVDNYIQQNGSYFPERGSFSYIKNGALEHIVYYIVDQTTIRLNQEYPNEAFCIRPEPGCLVFDRITNTSYEAE